MPDPQLQPSRREPELVSALERVYDAGHQLIVQRIDLLSEEAKLVLRDALRALAGGVLVIVGWVFAMAGLVEVLAQELPRSAVALVIGLLHMAVGLVLAARNRPGVGDGQEP